MRSTTLLPAIIFLVPASGYVLDHVRNAYSTFRGKHALLRDYGVCGWVLCFAFHKNTPMQSHQRWLSRKPNFLCCRERLKHRFLASKSRLPKPGSCIVPKRRNRCGRCTTLHPHGNYHRRIRPPRRKPERVIRPPRRLSPPHDTLAASACSRLQRITPRLPNPGGIRITSGLTRLATMRVCLFLALPLLMACPSHRRRAQGWVSMSGIIEV